MLHEPIFGIVSSQLSQEVLQKSFALVNELYVGLAKEEDNRDVVAKGTEFLAALKKRLPKAKTGENSAQDAEKRKKIRDVIKYGEFRW